MPGDLPASDWETASVGIPPCRILLRKSSLLPTLSIDLHLCYRYKKDIASVQQTLLDRSVLVAIEAAAARRGYPYCCPMTTLPSAYFLLAGWLMEAKRNLRPAPNLAVHQRAGPLARAIQGRSDLCQVYMHNYRLHYKVPVIA